VSDQVSERASTSFAVVDTMIASAILVGNRHPKAADLLHRYQEHLRGMSIVLSFASVCELRYGAMKGQWGPARIGRMEDWFRQISIVMPDNDLVETCANLRHECQKQGHGLKDKVHDSDRWIASTAIRHNVPLISDDRVFSGAPVLHLLQLDR
jgi:predicted nucleic acid-binding protein